jgi:hypothetical protein
VAVRFYHVIGEQMDEKIILVRDEPMGIQNLGEDKYLKAESHPYLKISQ